MPDGTAWGWNPQLHGFGLLRDAAFTACRETRQLQFAFDDILKRLALADYRGFVAFDEDFGGEGA